MSEGHIVSLIQDRKGFVWFGTHDGLNRFDGYSFRCFRGKPWHKYKLLNFRVNKIVEDYQGKLWIQTDDGRIFRFDPAIEDFLPVPQFNETYKDYNIPLSRIMLMPDSSVWLMNGKEKKQYVFRFSDNGKPLVEEIKINLNNPKRILNKIFQDLNHDTWFLTSRGLDIIRKGSSEIVSLHNIYYGNFICVNETKNNISFGTDSGNIIIYDKKMRMFSAAKMPCTNSNYIVDVIQVSATELFSTSNSSSFYIYHLDTKKTESYTLGKTSTEVIKDAYMDNEGRVWIDTDMPGIYYFDLKTRKLQTLAVERRENLYPNNPRFLTLQDNLKRKWFLTNEGGLYRYNQSAEKLEPLVIDEVRGISVSNMIHQAMADKQGNLWLNAYHQGLDKIVFRKSQFTIHKIDYSPGYKSKNEVRSVLEDRYRQLWVGSKKGYVYIYDEKRVLKGFLGADGNLNSSVPFNSPVYSMFEDENGAIWLGTKGKGLYRLTRKPNGSYSVENYAKDDKNPFSISSNSVYSIFQDNKKRIWLGTFDGGLNLIDETNGEIRFVNQRNKLKNYPEKKFQKVRFVCQDIQGRLLIGTTAGFLVSDIIGNIPEQIKFKVYNYNPDENNSLAGNDVYYIHQTPNKDIYISVIGGGLHVVRGGIKEGVEPAFEKLRSADEMPITTVYTICSDKKGNLWMSTQNQILCFEPASGKTQVYTPEYDENYFIDEASMFQTREGEILYGTSNGLISFNPTVIKKSSFVPYLALTDFRLFNKVMEPDVKNSPLKVALDYTTELELDHEQSTFSIEFSALDYQNPEKIQYAYKMEGLDDGWNYSGNQRIATYINLPKGKFVFKVKSTNSDGIWVENERSIVIIKSPSFWESGWGILFYIITFLLLSFVVVYVLFTIFRLRNEIDVEHRISSIKLRFFTDISHELRTPLTLISAPVENILKKENLTSGVKSQLQIVQKNTDRMLRLINQILDFRKIQNDKMNLVLEQVDIAGFVNMISSSFVKFTEEKGIEVIIDNQLPDNYLLWVDKDKFEKIFFNLVSNALKFSGQGKRIDIKLADAENDVMISVRDQGIGIATDKLRYLFERFESIANTSSAFEASTGIGLSLTKELVELHKARVEVESESGKGTEFRLFFKKGVDVYKNQSDIVLMDSVRIEDEMPTDLIVDSEELLPSGAESELIRTDETRRILIVEDNFELRNFLKSFLIAEYDILEAENGVKALDLARTQLPDLIISDIMMPDMDGLQLAKLVKEDIALSHIPFIMLTAKADIETKLSALESGVDDYITKPFSSNYLEARIENLLRLRSQLQSYFRSSLTSGIISMSKPEMSDFDDMFIKKTMQYLEENYSNSEMIIEDIATSMGMSRSAFFKKLKNMTGIAPVDFVREFRLQRSAQLLDAGETNISQIAYSVGMNDPRYFSRCFKQKFGVNPSEYKSKKR